MVNQFQTFFFPLISGKIKSDPIDLEKSFAVAEKLFVTMRKPPLPPPASPALFKGVIHTMSK